MATIDTTDLERLIQELKNQDDDEIEVNLAIGEESSAGAIAPPDSKQIKIIRELTGKDSDPEDWLCVPCHASDSLVDRSDESWHPNILNQMLRNHQGCQMTTDHRWSANASVGFLIQPELMLDPNPSKEILSLIGKQKFNQKICDRDGGMRWLRIVAVLPSDSEAAEKVQSRKYQYLSTGGKLRNPRRICPNCTEIHGREVLYKEKDKDGRYVCPHVAPSPYLDWAKSRGWVDKDIKVSDYTILDGTYHNVELSFVMAGNLPAASILR
ncbi:MAG: hypothetical protein F6K65_32795 [Moorea sp. SIO3C2]|nr:hypothetical protein [Moorena sp. SIO3C2]